MSVTVLVTAAHAAAGASGHAGRCPLALALAEALPGSQPVVCGQWCWLTRPGGRARLRHDFPPEIGRRVEAYDAGAEMESFSFTLREGVP